MPRLSDNVKESWEDVTLALFMWHRRAAGGPDYEFVRTHERPDRIIRVVGCTHELGVEITRCVYGRDAEADQRISALSDALRCELSSWAHGGRIHLSGGDFPDCGKNAVARLTSALRDAIRSRGSLPSFLASLNGQCWRYEDTSFHISSDADDAGWAIADNHLRGRPGRRQIPAAECDDLLLERVRDKAKKGPGYMWDGPMILLVRNPYGAYWPSARTVDTAHRLLSPAFREAWLVNHTEGVVDASPPEPRLVPLLAE